MFSAASRDCGRRVFRHAQIIEDETGTEAEGAHHFSDRLRGFLEGFEDTDGEATQAGEIFRAEAGADATAVFIEVPVDEVMYALYGPVSAIDLQYTLR